jgi:hypothetical protein
MCAACLELIGACGTSVILQPPRLPYQDIIRARRDLEARGFKYPNCAPT